MSESPAHFHMPTRDDVYLEFGKAAELAQLLETELGTALLADEAFENKAHLKPNPAHYQSFLEVISKDTLGSNLRRIRARFGLTQNLDSVFSSALKRRNRLVHGFFLKYGLSIEAESGRDKMINSLIEPQDELRRAVELAGYLSHILLNAVKLLHKDHKKQ